MVPTRGDWRPRNWLVDGGVVPVIDVGRAALRPALTDFTRVAAQDSVAGAWFRQRVREAVGTAAWACAVGDTPFEAQGHRMIADVLAEA